MTQWIRLLSLLLLLFLCTPAHAKDEEPPFMKSVYPPELLMRNAREIGLRPEQRKAITQAVAETQAQVIDLQWQMQEEAQALTKALSESRVDETNALATVDRMMKVEAQVKRAHLALLIRIKNELDPAQQQKLSQLR